MKSLIYNILYYSGFNSFFGTLQNKKLFVVMYHSIGRKGGLAQDKKLYEHISINEDDFKKQLLYMKEKGHTFISLADLGKLSQQEFNSLNKPTILYFDDGFKDLLTTAVPFLKEQRIPATFFIITGIPDKTHMVWTLVCKEALTKQGIPENQQRDIIEMIKRGSDAERKALMAKYPVRDHPHLFDLFMSWDEIRSLAKDGFTIGSHSVSHPRLTESSKEEAEQEISLSKKRIEEETHNKVTAFSFPHGRGNDELVHALTNAGYKHILSRGRGLNDANKLGRDVFYLKNISPKPGDTLKMFALKLYSLNMFR